MLDHRNYGFSTVPMWDNLGVILDKPPSNIAEAMRLGKMDWLVLEKPNMYLDHNDKITISPKLKSLVREDTGELLSIQNMSWNVVQNQRLFEIFEPMIESGRLELQTGVCLDGGRQIALTAKIKDLVGDVVNGDPVEAFLVLYNSHGTLKICLGCQFTNIRVICANTLGMVLREGRKIKFDGRADVAMSEKGVRFRHTSTIHQNLELMQDMFLWRTKCFDKSLIEYQDMSRIFMTTNQVIETYSKIFEIEEKDVVGHTHYEKIIKSFESGLGSDIPGVARTGWSFYNGITDFTSHLRNSRGESESDKARARFNSLYFGDSAKLNSRAHEAILELAA